MPARIRGLGMCAAEILAIAVLVVLLVAVFLAGRRAPEPFVGFADYAPMCETGSANRWWCRGLTTGGMPAIETTDRFGNGLCCSWLGVPP